MPFMIKKDGKQVAIFVDTDDADNWFEEEVQAEIRYPMGDRGFKRITMVDTDTREEIKAVDATDILQIVAYSVKDELPSSLSVRSLTSGEVELIEDALKFAAQSFNSSNVQKAFEVLIKGQRDHPGSNDIILQEMYEAIEGGCSKARAMNTLATIFRRYGGMIRTPIHIQELA